MKITQKLAGIIALGDNGINVVNIGFLTVLCQSLTVLTSRFFGEKKIAPDRTKLTV